MNRILLAMAGMFVAALPATAAPVTWTFFETGCTSSSGGPCHTDQPVPLPFALATLTLPGPTSTGTAFWLGPGTNPVYTGDSFTFTLATGEVLTPAFTGTPNCQSEGATPRSLCDFDLSWSATGNHLNAVSINLLSFSDQIGGADLTRPFGLTGGLFGSDGHIDNCEFAVCTATGFWQSNLAMPEPRSVMLLASGLFGAWLVRRRPAGGRGSAG